MTDCRMATSVPTVLKVLASSINVSNKAGSIIRDIMNKGDLGIIEKAKNDPQTEADRSAQRCIIASLSRQYPKMKIIGEEGSSDLQIPDDWLVTSGCENLLSKTCPAEFHSVREEDIVVWVDPLDGTNEYTQGFLDHVTVLIGIAVNSVAVGGVIHQPYFKKDSSGTLGRTIWGLQGLGVGGFEPKSAPDNKFIITTTRSHSNAIVQAALDSLNPDEVLKVGGAGYKVLQLLEGQAHAYVFASPGCKKWDTCAPEAILEAAGGCLTDVCGVKYKYGADVEHPNRHGVFATAAGMKHVDLVNRLPKSVKDSLKC